MLGARGQPAVDVVAEGGAVGGEGAVGAHRARVYREDVAPPRRVGERDLEVHLEASGAEERPGR